MDLRGTIRALARLPFDGEELIGILRQSEAAVAGDPNDPDHSVFWLVAADQFAKRGIACASASASGPWPSSMAAATSP